MQEYFAGARRTFDVALDWRLSSGFRSAVLHRLPDIGYGHTASYAAVAQLAGNPTAVRAVGSACATNPLPVVVPCHRVVRSDGSVGGYLGGIEAKPHPARSGVGRLITQPPEGREPGMPTTSARPTEAAAMSWEDRVAAVNWNAVRDELDTCGCVYPRLLPIARDWWTRLRRAAPWPDTLEEPATSTASSCSPAGCD